MKNLTEQQLLDNYQKLLDVVEEHFDGERKEKILKMYDFFKERIIVAPASGKPNYHYCFVGGYVEHVLHIVQTAKELMGVYERVGGVIDFTLEELVFSALHHDLGKVGDMDHDYYVPQESEWHRKNRGEIFTHNGNLSYMTVTDRAIFILNHFGVKMSQWEYIGLRLTDGMYEEANKSYYMSYNPDWGLKSNIAYILHQADMMATHIEFDQWQRQDEEVSNKFKKAVVTEEKPQPSPKLSEKSQDLFDELFGDK